MSSLYLRPAGLCCALGLDLRAATLAIRAGIAALDELWILDDEGEPIVGAEVPGLDRLPASRRVLALLTRVIEEAARAAELEIVDRCVVVCSEVATRRLRLLGPELAALVHARTGVELRALELIAGDETSAVRVLARLELEPGREVLLCATDSSIDAYTLARASSRLRRDDSGRQRARDGFSPGEAAACVWVGRAPRPGAVRVAGLGFALESATILDARPHAALAMTAAAREALQQAGCSIDEVGQWISDLAGEHYEFNELALAGARLPVRRGPEPELCHTSEFVGSVGVAAAVVSWILAGEAGEAGQDPRARRALCSSSSAEGARALVVLERGSPALARGRSAVIHEQVVLRHAEEATFLAELRELGVRSPHCGLGRLARIEARLAVHLDALAHAGEAGWEVSRGAWSGRAPDQCFVALSTALALGSWPRIDELLDALSLPQAPDPEVHEQLDACVAALARLPPDRAQVLARWWLAQADPLRRALGLACLLAHDLDPGPALAEGLDSPFAWTRALAWRGVATLGLGLDDGRDLDDPCARARLFATLARLRRAGFDRGCCEALIELAPACPRDGDLAVQLGFSGLPLARADALLQGAQGQGPWARRRALLGVAGVGDPALVPWLIDRLGDPEDGLAASYALLTLTGLDVETGGIVGGVPEGWADEPPAIDLSCAPPQPDVFERFEHLDPDIDSPWLDPEATRAWWEVVDRQLRAGQPVMLAREGRAGLHHALREGPQRLRAAAAWRLAIARPGPVFPYDAPAERQRAYLLRDETP